MSGKKTSPGISALGPAQRVSVTTEVKENSPATKAASKSLKTTPSSVSRAPKPRRGVKFAQEEALRAFGGKSLGNVLTDAPARNTDSDAASIDLSRPLSRKQKREQEALEAFQGADLAQITNEVKQKLEEASAKHMTLVEQSAKEILRKKIDLPREGVAKTGNNGWDKDFAEVDFKPGLSRVERDRLEYLASKAASTTTQPKKEKKAADSSWGSGDLAQVDFKPGLSKVEREKLEFMAANKTVVNKPAQQKQKNSDWQGDLAELDVKPGLSKMERERMEYLAVKQQQQQEQQQQQQQQQPKQTRPAQNFAAAAAQEEEARLAREKERLARAEARKQAEQAQKERVRLAKEQRNKAKMAPFMQQKQEEEEEEAVKESATQPPAVQPPSEQKDSPCVVVVESAPQESSQEIAAAPSPIVCALSPIAAAESDKANCDAQEECDQHQGEDDGDCLTPGKCFRTAVSSLVNSPADALNLDESMGELLEQISMSNLSDELTPNCSASAGSEDDVVEIQSSLQKRKTPIVRQPFYDAPVINDQLREALNEIAQQNDNREEALLASMRDSLNSLTVKQLKEELKERNLKVSGLKSELVERLIEHRKENAASDNGKCIIC